MQKLALAVLASIALLSIPALGQDMQMSGQPRCWVGSIGFTTGAVVRAGSQAMICAEDNSWKVSDSKAAGCFYDGKLFGVGAVASIPNNKAFSLECTDEGTWLKLPISE